MSRSTSFTRTVRSFWDGDVGQRIRKVFGILTSSKSSDTYASLPLSLRAVGIGAILSAMFIALMNFFIVWSIRSTYSSHVAAAVQARSESATATDGLIKSGIASESLRFWLDTFVRPDMPAKEMLLSGLNSLASSNQSTWTVESTLRQLATGDIRYTWLFPLRDARSVSSREVIDALLAKADHWQTALDAQEDAPARREFLEAVASDLIGASRPGVRNLRRLNGWCQYLTIALAATLLVVVAQRSIQIDKWRRLDTRELDSHEVPEDIRRIDRLLSSSRIANESHSSRLMVLQEESVQIQQQLDNEVYEPLGTFATFLPSLGFIGTVLGMGGALLIADRLFDSDQRSVAIGQMTEELGFAFDTTLVSLLCSLIVSVAIAWVRKKDSKLKQTLFDAIERDHLPSDAKEELHVAS